jgi:hypothetical protein
MYKSIIDIIHTDMEIKMEGEIMKAVKRCNIEVDKEELLKALQYDRGQYEQGYQDGLNADKWIPCEERLPSVGDAVLVVDEYALYDVCTVIERYGEMMLENSSGCWLDIENYIAWQPLPTPYKKEGAENE